MSFVFVADVNHILAINKDHIVVSSGSTLEVCLVTAGPDTHGGATYQLERVKKLVPIHKENVTCMILVGGKKHFFPEHFLILGNKNEKSLKTDTKLKDQASFACIIS